jgi:TolA-binding protein
MTDPKRLLLDEGSEEERRLLQAGAAEQPPADGAARLALALAGPAALPSGGVGAETSAKAGWAKLAGAKLSVKAALIAGAGAAVALTLTLRSPTATPSHAPSTAPAATSETVEPLEAAAKQEPGARTAGDSSSAGRSLTDEVARLDNTRRMLAAGHPDLALSMLDAYRVHHPQGTLAPEALRLRVETWLAKGDLKRARELAHEFLRAYPQSPHAATLRRIAERELNDDAARRP